MNRHLRATVAARRRNRLTPFIAIFFATVAAQAMACGSVKSTNRPLLQQPESTAKPAQTPTGAAATGK
jgi:hypothetical protein